jgi:hypothetical protein
MPMASGSIRVSPLTHAHASLFFGWLLFFVYQSRLVASGRTAKHRNVGLAGISLATAMFFAGNAVAIQRILALEAAGQGEAARRFSVIPFTAILFFGVLFALAIRNVRTPAVHKRLLLVATVSMLQAAVGRLTRLAAAGPPPTDGLPPLPPSVALSIVPGVLVDLLIVAAMVHDYRSTGRVHRVYVIAGGALLALQVLRVPLSATGAWMRFTYVMTAFAGG